MTHFQNEQAEAEQPRLTDIMYVNAKGQEYLAGLQIFRGVKEGIESDPILNQVLNDEFIAGNAVVRGIHRYCETEEDRKKILDQLQEQGIDTQLSYNPNSGESLHMFAGFAGDKSWSQAMPYTVDSEQNPSKGASISMGLILVYENTDGRIVYNAGGRLATKDHPIITMDMKRRDDQGSIMVLDEQNMPQFNNPELANFWKQRLKKIIVIDYPMPEQKKNKGIKSLFGKLF